MFCVYLVQSVQYAYAHYMLNNSEASRSKTETVEEKVPIGPHDMALAAVRHYVYG